MKERIVKPIVSRKHSLKKIDKYNKVYHVEYYCRVCNEWFSEDYESDQSYNTLCKPHYICPECHTVLSKEQEEKYCRECGVKFDWSEAETQEEIEQQGIIDDIRTRVINKYHEKAGTIISIIDLQPEKKRVKYFNLALSLLESKTDIEIKSISNIRDFKIACTELGLI